CARSLTTVGPYYAMDYW
nr:immunoglobulin heavy chain junction region [Mus musculus]